MPLDLDPNGSWAILFYEDARYAVQIVPDDHHGAPWDEEDGHGPVSDWVTRDKRPGEMLLAEDGRRKRYYDFAAAVAIAKRDGWDAPPYKTGTKGQTAARAAMADYAHLRGWCSNDWQYVGVIVAPVCACCGEIKNASAVSLWGIESTDKSYLDEVALELAAELHAA